MWPWIVLIATLACEPAAGGPSDPLAASHTGLYVAPNGAASGDGTSAKPWDLVTAFNQPVAVQAGDTIWLRGGTYRGVFTSRLTGTASAPIIVRQYPGERAIIDGSVNIDGAYTWYWGFEVANTNTGTQDVMGLDVNAPGAKLINLVVHDHSGNGIGIWEPAPNSEVYGSIVYNNGFRGSSCTNLSDISTCSHGHGIYNQNVTGTRLLGDNIIFNQFGYDIHMYGDVGHEENVTLDGNVIWGVGLGVLGKPGTAPVVGMVVKRNMALKDANQAAFALNGIANGDLQFTDNYVVAGNTKFINWTRLTNTGNAFISHGSLYLTAVPSIYPASPTYVWNTNTYVGQLDGTHPRPFFYPTLAGVDQGIIPIQIWPAASGYDSNSTSLVTADGKPTTNVISVRPNTYEAGRANVVVFNWQHLASVAVDLSGVLKIGDQYVIQNAQDLYGVPTARGTYNGGAVTVPMVAVPPPPPIVGWLSTAPAPTGPAFNAFVVLRTGP